MPRIFWPILSILALAVLAAPADSASAQQPAAADTSRPVVLVPAAVWDGVAEAPVRGWVVVVRGERIVAAGPLPAWKFRRTPNGWSSRGRR